MGTVLKRPYQLMSRLGGASSTGQKAADRLRQSSFDLFASPVRTVFLSDPLRQLGGASSHVGVVVGCLDCRSKSAGGELINRHRFGSGASAVNRGPPEVLVALEGANDRWTCCEQPGSCRPSPP